MGMRKERMRRHRRRRSRSILKKNELSIIEYIMYM